MRNGDTYMMIIKTALCVYTLKFQDEFTFLACSSYSNLKGFSKN